MHVSIYSSQGQKEMCLKYEAKNKPCNINEMEHTDFLNVVILYCTLFYLEFIFKEILVMLPSSNIYPNVIMVYI